MHTRPATVSRHRGHATIRPVLLVLPLCLALPMLAVGNVALAADPAQAGRIAVRSQDEIPRHRYELPTATASALLDDDDAFAAFAAEVERDIEGVLRDYAIDDKATLRGLYNTLADLATIRGDQAALRTLAPRLRELADKPARQQLSGLRMEALAAALDAPVDARAAAYRAHYADAISKLPWEVVQDDVRSTKGWFEVANESLLRGEVTGGLDPILEKNGSLDDAAARQLIASRAAIAGLAYSREVAAVLADYIARHDRRKPDIWQARNVVLAADQARAPVVIGIWDSGVDVSLFDGHLFRNPGEQANGRDDDGNGFVDDLHGIAYGMYGGESSPALLLPLDEALRPRIEEIKPLYKGRMDLMANIDSEEAALFRARIAALKPEEVRPLGEAASLFGEYAHGTHVAGIAVEGNPAARLLAVRQNFSWTAQRAPITPDAARQWAERMRQTGKYLHDHGARAVTMSWGIGFREIEGTLEEGGIGKDAAERRALADESLRILTEGLADAIRGAPGTLFIPAAGNADEDVGIHRDIPTAIDLPNLLFVGAVDQAGEPTSFTSTGERVRIYASGFQVDSLLPGGDRMAWSGTSMAAPQVANLAAKLWAIEPSLGVPEVVALILDGADPGEDGARRLLHPKRSLELLAARRSQAGAGQ